MSEKQEKLVFCFFRSQVRDILYSLLIEKFEMFTRRVDSNSYPDFKKYVPHQTMTLQDCISKNNRSKYESVEDVGKDLKQLVADMRAYPPFQQGKERPVIDFFETAALQKLTTFDDTVVEGLQHARSSRERRAAMAKQKLVKKAPAKGAKPRPKAKPAKDAKTAIDTSRVAPEKQSDLFPPSIRALLQEAAKQLLEEAERRTSTSCLLVVLDNLTERIRVHVAGQHLPAVAAFVKARAESTALEERLYKSYTKGNGLELLAAACEEFLDRSGLQEILNEGDLVHFASLES
jgi:hypothetical protein